MESRKIPYFQEITGQDEPFPWQKRLYTKMCTGEIPQGVNIPTGLGKSTCILLYLLAKAHGAPLPTRLIYVVDRRTIVDQTAVSIREWSAKIQNIPELAKKFHDISVLPSSFSFTVGVLRGGFADDGEWRNNPTRPGVIVGTVDMIGSRLLFSGYGDGLSRRPMHAGLLGYDATVFLDEAHLSPAMGFLLRNVEKAQGFTETFRVMTLSATGMDTQILPFELDQHDYNHAIVKMRLEAVKNPQWVPTARKTGKMVEIAKSLAKGSVLIFSLTVNDAKSVAKSLSETLGKERVILLTGTMRGKERNALYQHPVWQRFSPNRDRTDTDALSVFLVSTSAGEVGVDIDADHGIMDLTTLDSMIQRLGRINRAGMVSSDVYIVYNEKEILLGKEPITTDSEESRDSSNDIEGEESGRETQRRNKNEIRSKAITSTYNHLKSLGSLSPAALKIITPQDIVKCTVSKIKIVPLWETTIERLTLTGVKAVGSPIDLLLHGILDDPQEPDTYLLWRQDIGLLAPLGDNAANEAVAFFPPLPEELVRLPKKEAVGLLQNAIRRESIQGRTLAVILRNERGDSKVCILKNPDDIDSLPLDNSTVFLPTHAGCLDPRGFPDPDSAEPVEDIADTDDRRRIFPDDPEAPIPKGWSQLRLNIQQDDENEAEPRWLLYRVSGKKTWHWDADSDLTSVAMNNQTLAEHHRRVGEVVRKMAERLNLEPEITKALGIAGENHDLGKRAKVWQKAAGISKNSPPMAKSQEGRFQPEVLGGYRHEFGSLMELERNLDSNTPLRDLILHLVAAHHGRGRPGFEDPRQWSQEFPEEANLEMAKAVAMRFGQVQGRWGPWRLAWMESLLKAADAAVSSWRDVGGERL